MSIDTLEQFEQMKKIGAIVANCLELVKAKTRAGMTTLELDAIAAKYLAQFGAISAPISCYQFPGSICISLEKEAAHGIPSATRVIQDGDLINVDVSAHLDAKRASIACHASQVSDSSMFLQMPPDVFANAFGHEWFIEPGQPGGARPGWFM